jgi:hypothetical protein
MFQPGVSGQTSTFEKLTATTALQARALERVKNAPVTTVK